MKECLGKWRKCPEEVLEKLEDDMSYWKIDCPEKVDCYHKCIEMEKIEEILDKREEVLQVLS